MAPRRRAICQICGQTVSKYACPTCEVLYCSVPCYKQHKSSSCSAAGQTSCNTRIPQIGPAAAVNDDNDDVALGAKGKLTAVSDALPTLVPDRGDDASALDPVAHVRQGERVAETTTRRKLDGEGEGEGDAGGGADATPGCDQSLDFEAPRPLRKLSSLKWPYVPDMSSYPDPLTRDDPKPLNLTQYEAIARSPAIRHALSTHTRLPSLLRSLDALRGDAREAAVQRVLGVAPSQSSSFALAPALAPARTSISSSSPSYAPTPTTSSAHHGGHGRRIGRNGDDAPETAVVDEEDMRALRALAEAVEGAVRSPAGASAVDGRRSGSDPLGLDWEGMEV